MLIQLFTNIPLDDTVIVCTTLTLFIMKTKLLTALVTATLKTLLLYQEKSHILFPRSHIINKNSEYWLGLH